MKVACTLLTLATIAISGATALKFDQTISQNNTNGTVPTPLTWGPQVRYFSALARGFIQGYRRGMYKDNNYRVANNCFDR